MSLDTLLEMIIEAFKIGFSKASFHIRDYRNKSQFIEFIDDKFTIESFENTLNKIGDGHTVLAVTFL